MRTLKRATVNEPPVAYQNLYREFASFEEQHALPLDSEHERVLLGAINVALSMAVQGQISQGICLYAILQALYIAHGLGKKKGDRTIWQK